MRDTPESALKASKVPREGDYRGTFWSPSTAGGGAGGADRASAGLALTRRPLTGTEGGEEYQKMGS